MFAVSVKARPGSIPNSIELDISAMVPGDLLRVADLPLPDGVEADTDPEAAIAIAHVGRTSGSLGEGAEEAVVEGESEADAEA